MAEPTNFSWKEYFCLQWAELLKAVMAECIYLLEEPILSFNGGNFVNLS